MKLSKTILAFLLILLLTNISLANNPEYTNNIIPNETSLNLPINLTIFELLGTITDKENNTKGNFSHYLIGFEFKLNDNNTTTYIPFEELMIIINSSGIFNYTYYISDNFIQIRYTNGTILNETYYYADGKLVAKKDNSGNKTYYHPDHLGSTTLVTNQSGSIVEEEFYLPHGDVYSGSESSRYLYTGKELDKAIDLYYYGARYYQASIMRMFIQPDSVISDIYNPQNLNKYSYVLNNPYKYVDESGNLPILVTAAIGAGIGGTIGFVSSAVQSYVGTGQVNWADAGKSAAIGAASGGIAGLTLGLGSALVGAAGLTGTSAIAAEAGVSATSSVIGGQAARAGANIATGNALTEGLGRPGDIATDAAIGLATYGVSKYLSSGSSSLSSEVSSTSKSTQSHILQSKHNWGNVVKDPKDWKQVSSVINQAMKQGTEVPYKSGKGVFSKSSNVKGGRVEVTYKKDAQGIRISDAWVSRK